MEVFFKRDNLGWYAEPHEARSHGAATSTPRTYNLARTRELRLHSPMVTCVKQPPNEDRPLPIADNHDTTTFHAREMLEQAYHLGVAIHVFPRHTTCITQPLDARDVNM